MESRVKAMLRHRGVDWATAEDVAQETAVRALCHRVSFVGSDDLFRWASTVSWRLAIDARRKAVRLDGGPLPDRQSAANVAVAVEQRSALEAVGRGLQGLSEADRGAILGPLRNEHRPGDGAQAAAAAVRRHRARNRLLAATRGFLGVLGWLVVRRRPWTPRRAVAVAVAAPALIVAVTLAPPPQAGADGTLAPAPAAARPASTAAPAPGAASETAAPVVVVETASQHATQGGGDQRPAPVRSVPDLPPVAVRVTDPTGAETTAGTRPRTPEDRDVCVRVVRDRTCVDKPVDVPVEVPALP